MDPRDLITKEVTVSSLKKSGVRRTDVGPVEEKDVRTNPKRYGQYESGVNAKNEDLNPFIRRSGDKTALSSKKKKKRGLPADLEPDELEDAEVSSRNVSGSLLVREDLAGRRKKKRKKAWVDTEPEHLDWLSLYGVKRPYKNLHTGYHKKHGR